MSNSADVSGTGEAEWKVNMPKGSVSWEPDAWAYS